MRHLICFGNALHGDDGFGPAVARRLAARELPADLRLFEAGTRGLDALPLLQGCEEALLVDALAPAGDPGRLRVLSPEEVPPEGGIAGHGGGVGYLLQAHRALAGPGSGPRLRLLTAEAGALTPFRPGLSAPMTRALERALELIARWAETRALG